MRRDSPLTWWPAWVGIVLAVAWPAVFLHGPARWIVQAAWAAVVITAALALLPARRRR